MLQQLVGRCYLPSGRWNSHMLQQPFLVGVICQVADGIATVGWMCMLDGISIGRWNSQGSVQFSLSSEVLNGTASHICGRWNLPMFLLRYGLFTLINNASLIALLRSLNIIYIINMAITSVKAITSATKHWQ